MKDFWKVWWRRFAVLGITVIIFVGGLTELKRLGSGKVSVAANPPVSCPAPVPRPCFDQASDLPDPPKTLFLKKIGNGVSKTSEYSVSPYAGGGRLYCLLDEATGECAAFLLLERSSKDGQARRFGLVPVPIEIQPSP